jgi:hypothetical protein
MSECLICCACGWVLGGCGWLRGCVVVSCCTLKIDCASNYFFVEMQLLKTSDKPDFSFACFEHHSETPPVVYQM